jgi:hypothetical protein
MVVALRKVIELGKVVALGKLEMRKIASVE